MSITLDANLKTALDGQSHNPIVKIISKGAKATDLPVTGNYFNLDDEAEGYPSTLLHSSGRLVMCYAKDDGSGKNDLYFACTDTDRLTWSHTKIYDQSVDEQNYGVSWSNAMIELANGNLAIVFITYYSSVNTARLRRITVSPTGSIVTSVTTIASYATGTSYPLYPALCETSNGFLLVYVRYTVSGGTYDLYKRTTTQADFSSWSSESALSISGWDPSYYTRHPVLYRHNGCIYLMYDWCDDYTDASQYITNIYQSKSTDNGATWGAQLGITNYTEQGTRASHAAIKKRYSDDDIRLTYTEIASVLVINQYDTGSCKQVGYDDTMWLNIDEVSRTLFAAWGNAASGYNYTSSVVAIDIDTWSIDNCYTWDSGSPQYDDMYGQRDTSFAACKQDPSYNGCLFWGGATYRYHAAHINNQSQTIQEFNFVNWGTYGLVKNVDWDYDGWVSWTYDLAICATYIDMVNERFWFAMYGDYSSGQAYEFGYIEMAAQQDPISGLYPYNIVGQSWVSSMSYLSMTGGRMSRGFNVDAAQNRVIQAGQNTISSWKGMLSVYNYTTGSLIKRYYPDTHSGFHYRGCNDPVLYDNKVYASLIYEPLYGQEERRGMIIVNMEDDSFTYSRPTYAQWDNYNLRNLKIIDTETADPKIVMLDPYWGVVFYHLNTGLWTWLSEEDIPGLVIDGKQVHMAYDSVGGQVFIGEASSSGDSDSTDIQTFKVDGDFEIGYMYDGLYNGTAANHTFQNLQQVTEKTPSGFMDIVIDEDDVEWFTWIYEDLDIGDSLMWDRTQFEPQLQDYLIAGTPVQITWEAEKYAKGSFTLARGDLFDPTNLTSIYAPVLTKGRMVDIYFGENVSGTDYFQKQGEFFVTGTRTAFNKQGHPKLTVEFEDPSTFWDDYILTASEGHRGSNLSSVLAGILEDALGYSATDYVNPTWNHLHSLYCQWVEVSIEDIMSEIDTHFGCFRHWGADNKLRWKYVDLSGDTVHHTYSSLIHVIDYQPTDRYGSFINRVTVKCEGIDPLEVLWDEETIENLNGTLGFWCKEDEFKVYYSKDRTRRVRHPRLEVIESLKDYSPLLNLLGANADEYINDEDPNETWCQIKQEAPDRAVYVLGFSASVLALGYAAIGCDVDWTCAVWIMLTNLALSALIQVLAAEANWRYTLWGRPVGHEMETYQGSWNDTDFQTLMGGIVIPYEFEDPLSYTVAHCIMVATQEGKLLQAQRDRVTFVKTAHLMDELGDTIQINHPVSNQAIKFFIAKLVRTFVQPAGNSGGKFTDTIDGWRIVG